MVKEMLSWTHVIDKEIENMFANDVFPNLVFTEQVGLRWWRHEP